ncbi:MAG TPA: MFS transporter [Thermomicrobiales bacterium]|nr:MFS transporter [Thermomicrobiales bacterium]
MQRSFKHLLPRVGAIGITQIVGWGSTFNLPGVLGDPIAADLGFSLTIALLGPTVMLVVLAAVSWFLAGTFERFGTRTVMTAGTVLAALGLLLLSGAQGRITWLLPWIVIGVAGAGILTTAAQIAVAEIAGENARQWIGILALFGGLASTIFWPLANALDDAAGWRTTLVVMAASFLVVCLPLIRWAIPPHTPVAKESDAASPSGAPGLDWTAFWLMAGAIAANGFITWGFSLTLIPLFEDRGLTRAEAVAIASSLGLVQIGARAVDVLGGRRWSGLTTGLAASTVLPLAYILLLTGSGQTVVLTFVALYGLAGGAMAVARSTIPLAVFPREAYARASVRLALPLNLAFATAPPVFGAILTHASADTALLLATGLSTLALALLIALSLRTRSLPQGA